MVPLPGRNSIGITSAGTRFAEDFQYDANSRLRGNARRCTDQALVELMDSDDNLDIIVGGTDGLLHLLHNVQAAVNNGSLRVAGIMGQSFTGSYRDLAGNTAAHLLERLEQEWEPEHGARAAQQWVNDELTFLNRRRVQKDGPSSHIVRAGEEPASSWLREIKGRVQYVLGNDCEFLFEEDDPEQDVPWDANRGAFEVFPLTEGLETKQVPTFLISPPFLTSFLLNNHHPYEGMTVQSLQEYANTVAVAAFDFWRDDEFDSVTTAWNAAAFIQFKTDIADYINMAESQPNNIYVYKITEAPSIKNVRMMENARNQNGITIDDMHMEEKENFSGSRNT
jgi:hypothetical protein